MWLFTGSLPVSFPFLHVANLRSAATQKVQKCSAQYRVGSVGNNPADQPRKLLRRQFSIKAFPANKSAKSALLAIPNRKLPASRNTQNPYVCAVSRRSGHGSSDGAKRRFAESAERLQRESGSSHRNDGEGRKPGSDKRNTQGVDQSSWPRMSTLASRCLKAHKVVPGFAERYTIGDELGSGGFGFVVSAIRHPENTEVAVKFIWKDKVPVHAWIKDPALGLIPMEIYVLKTVDHPAIIRFVEYFEDTRYFYLVMELHGALWNSGTTKKNWLAGRVGQEKPRNGMVTPARYCVPRSAVTTNAIGRPEAESETAARKSGGTGNAKSKQTAEPAIPPRKGAVHRGSRDLFECIEQRTRFSEQDARYVFAQLVDAVKYLKSVGICHRDVKNENIVINKDLKIKLVDFGSAVVTTRRRVFRGFHGTLRYASPEILRGEPYNADAAEIWSLGVLLYTMLTGEIPFAEPEQAVRGQHAETGVRVSASAVDLLDWMLEKDASRRPDVVQVSRHPWLDGAAARPARVGIRQAVPAAADSPAGVRLRSARAANGPPPSSAAVVLGEEE